MDPFTTALEWGRRVRTKDVSPVEIVELYAQRIDELNPALGAYLTTAHDRALDWAREAEARAGQDGTGPLHGVPIPVKDLNDTAGIRSTHGTRDFAERVPDTDAVVVTKLKDAGMIVHGKTNTPEFGTTPWTEPEAYPAARNPWDTERTPGGSSGGAAAAVAAGLAPFAHGSDGGGSVRIPASVCGLFGIKPSRGRVSHAPGPQSLLSQSGPLARTVADAAALLDAMSGYVAGDSWWAPNPERPFLDEVGRDPGRLRIAWTTTPSDDVEVAAGNRRATEDAATLLAGLGHTVEEAKVPWPEGLTEAFITLWCVGRAAYQPAPAIERFGALNRTLAEMGLKTSARDYAEASAKVQTAARGLVAFFDDWDVVGMPTVATPPPRIGEHRDPDNPLAEFAAAAGFVPFTPPWNSTGQPAVSVPWDHDDHGLPVGVQLIGRPADEATLIRLSAQLEEARPWADRRPPVGQ